MTIKAVLRRGRIEPLEPLPTEWADGQELIIEQPEAAALSESQLVEWAKEIEAIAAQIPAEEHDRFLRALAENEAESKKSVRHECPVV